jgi:hypothetical protein
MRVAILPTGGMELRGVPPALERLFPGHEFYPVPKRSEPPVPFDSFTSSDKALRLDMPNGNVDKLVEQMAAELVPGRRGHAPDLLLVLEDLEVPNKHQPGVVVQVFRDATVRHVAELGRAHPKLASQVEAALLSKASFHLAVPMIEAWIFADPDGPAHAAVPPLRLPPSWVHTRDAEDFLTADPAYLADDCGDCAAWRALPPGRAKHHKPEWRRERRELHPKAFLSWLCRDPAANKCSRYRETHEGARALELLDWTAALRISGHCTFLRALVEDLSDGLRAVPAFPIDGEPSALTSHRQRRENPVLRNI